ncbi:hypothetical protein WJX72_004139 [[Myrmecia] bisecta]|uniref:DUF1230 family protein n=1 Tax=[Myrmecia] bisecta TaxID=41462 RepID=A0AAW1PS43_9CHLO
MMIARQIEPAPPWCSGQQAWRLGAVTRDEGSQDQLALGCPVPNEQQPVHELKALQGMVLFDWATIPLPAFVIRLLSVWAAFMVVFGLPISAATFSVKDQPVECLVAAGMGSLVVVTATVLRLYLGYAHVGNRLLSATVEYEECGWYDGQIWVKTPQVLLRDRLLGSYTVRPAMSRLRTTLISLAGSLVAATICMASLDAPHTELSIRAADISPVDASGTAQSTASQEEVDYWIKVKTFEPWAVDEAGQPSEYAERPLGPGHAFSNAPGIRYNG